jgi:hypothetical protein
MRSEAPNELNPIPSLRLPAFLLACFLIVVPLHGQKNRNEPLTEAQQDKIAEAGILPNARVELYTKFLNEHADVIQGLIKRAEAGRDQRIGSELQDFSDLMDELGSNLDTYGERKADIRKTLTPLLESIHRWQQILQSLPNRPGIQTSRDEAINAAKDLSDQSTQLIADQKKYFEEHKDEAGQDRAEPK